MWWMDGRTEKETDRDRTNRGRDRQINRQTINIENPF